MKKYISFFRIRFSNSLQYRAAALAGVATQFAWGILNILLFKAFYESDPAAFPMGFSQLASYIWLTQATIMLFMTWYFEADIFKSITNGGVAYELVRPMNLYTMWFTKSIANRLAKAVLRAFPILIFAAFLPAPYGLAAPVSFPAFLMFIFTAILAFLTVVSYGMLIYISTFYTMNPYGMRIISSVLSDALGGAIIPLPFLPEKLQNIINLTPFATMQNLPFRIYSGNIAGSELWRMAGLQVFWLAVLAGGGALFMKSALRRVVVQGG
jgi:ABC-2 type transport system permease protein